VTKRHRTELGRALSRSRILLVSATAHSRTGLTRLRGFDPSRAIFRLFVLANELKLPALSSETWPKTAVVKTNQTRPGFQSTMNRVKRRSIASFVSCLGDWTRFCRLFRRRRGPCAAPPSRNGLVVKTFQVKLLILLIWELQKWPNPRSRAKENQGSISVRLPSPFELLRRWRH